MFHESFDFLDQTDIAKHFSNIVFIAREGRHLPIFVTIVTDTILTCL